MTDFPTLLFTSTFEIPTLFYTWSWRRYEFYVLVAKTISHSVAALTREILFLPLEHKIHIFSPPCNILYLIYTTQVNSAFRARWLASSEVISQVLFTSEQTKENKMAFVGILSQIKLLFGPLVIQLVWYVLKQLSTSVSVKVIDIYLHFGE